MIKNTDKQKIVFMDTKLEVPYYSQYLDIDDKENCLKSCGITCIYMVLSYYKVTIPTLNEMVLNGIKNGGFGTSGWIHKYFVDLLNNFNLLSENKEFMRNSDIDVIHKNILGGYPVIISAERIIFDKKIFHMVVLTGIREDDKGNLEGFFYHDPASLDRKSAEHSYVPLKTFLLSWRKMAIFAQEKHK